MKAYHVAPADHDMEEGLMSLYEMHGDAAYEIFAERWPDAGELAVYHVNLIHMYNRIEDARNHNTGGKIYEIDCEFLEVRIDTLEFPHPVVHGQIDAEYLTFVESI